MILLKDQIRKVCINNAKDLLLLNNLNEEKIKVDASNYVYYAKEYSKLSYSRIGQHNFSKSIIINIENLIINIKNLKKNSEKKPNRINSCGEILKLLWF